MNARRKGLRDLPKQELKKAPSFVGEASAVVAVLSFIYWATAQTPVWAGWVWSVFGAVFILDWMLGGIADDGICKRCFGK